jgi:hypothetical protein
MQFMPKKQESWPRPRTLAGRWPTVPWEEVAVDLIGPWKIEVPDGTISFFPLTMIDTATTLSEIIRIENKTSQHVALQFENSWLVRYP